MIFEEILFRIRRWTGRYKGIVGLINIGLNDYHFYFDRKNNSFFYVGLNGGVICEFSDLEKAGDYLLKNVSNIDINNTLNKNLAIKLKKYAIQLRRIKKEMR